MYTVRCNNVNNILKYAKKSATNFVPCLIQIHLFSFAFELGAFALVRFKMFNKETIWLQHATI